MSLTFKFCVSLLMHVVLTSAGEVLPGELCDHSSVCIFDANRTLHENLAFADGCYTTRCCKESVTKLCAECDETGTCTRSDFVFLHWTSLQFVQFIPITFFTVFVSLVPAGLFLFVVAVVKDVRNILQLPFAEVSVPRESTPDLTTSQRSLAITAKVVREESEAGLLPVADVSIVQPEVSSLLVDDPLNESDSDLEAPANVIEEHRTSSASDHSLAEEVVVQGLYVREPEEPKWCESDNCMVQIFISLSKDVYLTAPVWIPLILTLAMYELLLSPCGYDIENKLLVSEFTCAWYFSNQTSVSDDIIKLFLVSATPMIYIVGMVMYVTYRYGGDSEYDCR